MLIFFFKEKLFLGGSDGKESACNAGDLGLIPQYGRSPGERYGYPLQYSCLENFMSPWYYFYQGPAQTPPPTGLPIPSSPSDPLECAPRITTADVQLVSRFGLRAPELGQDREVRQSGWESGFQHLPSTAPWRTGLPFISASPAWGLGERRWSGDGGWTDKWMQDCMCKASSLLLQRRETMMHSHATPCRTYRDLTHSRSLINICWMHKYGNNRFH